jgi:AmmeMemoRadiSam system protein A
MGSLVATQALVLDVAENAWSAAFRDPRFAPLSRAEWPTVTVHLSIIGDSEPLACQSQVELLATLRPGIDGLILDDGIHRATFLPSVWEQLPVAEDFVQQLKRKAGIPIQAWPSNLRCHRYQVESFARDNPSQ